MELFLNPISSFRLCAQREICKHLGGIQAYPMYLHHSLVPVSMAVCFTTFTVTCSYQTRSVEHVTAKVGEDQSHLGKQEVLECIVSE